MKKPIQSITRAFQILRVVHRHPQGVSVGVIAEQTALHVSTVSRILSTLEHVGAIRRLKRHGKVVIGQELLAFARQAPWTERLIAVAKPDLRELANLTKEAVGLTSIQGDECHIFFQIGSPHMIQIRDWTGEYFPLHTTSTGKLYLGLLDEPELADFLLRPLAPVASGTITDPDTLREEIERARQEGYAWTINELEDGLISIGAPIVDQEGQFLAGVYLSAPIFRFEADLEKEVLQREIVETAARISRHAKRG